MKKIKLPLGTSLLTEQRKEHFKRVLPFLRKPYRIITEKETKSNEVFSELFPGDAVDLSKLRAIFKFQQL